MIAACLTAPTGLAPLPDGTSALVGERTTGRILKVAAGTKPVVVTTISGIDAKGGGGLLGVAVSPSYVEDGLIYAYVTTSTDNRVIRIAPGDVPKPILTGIPKGPSNNGGGLAFTPDGVLYIGTGNAGSPAKAANPASLAGKLLRRGRLRQTRGRQSQVDLADLRQRLHPDHHDLSAADRFDGGPGSPERSRRPAAGQIDQELHHPAVRRRGLDVEGRRRRRRRLCGVGHHVWPTPRWPNSSSRASR